MKIGCLGWGSLIWDPRDLPIRGNWFIDGPILPIEFARESQDGRITLVLVNGVSLVRSLWALMSVVNPDEALKALANREGTILEKINIWKRGSEKSTHPFHELIGEWAKLKDLDAVIWTALLPQFKGQQNKIPSIEDVISHLSELPYEKRKQAELYIRKAPRQIDTDYRRRLESEFGWTPLSDI